MSVNRNVSEHRIDINDVRWFYGRIFIMV